MLPAFRHQVHAVLSIAGSDPSGGAGVQADLKTFAAFGVYGAAAITALTAQNARTVAGVQPVDPAFVELQLRTVLADIAFDAVKVGMLGTADVARAVARVLRDNRNENIVIDPVLRASAGASLLDDDGIGVLRDELLPLARLITPNTIEAGALLGRGAPYTLDSVHDAARDLRALGPAWVLVTGGHLDTGNVCTDVLCGPSGEIHEILGPRAAGPGRHGTGCTLSSAIAALLAQGEEMLSACEYAQAYVGLAISLANDSTIGTEPGPLIHAAYTPFMPGPTT